MRIFLFLSASLALTTAGLPAARRPYRPSARQDAETFHPPVQERPSEKDQYHAPVEDVSQSDKIDASVAIPFTNQRQTLSQKVANATNHFAFAMYQLLSQEAKDENVVFSPTSLSSAMAMLYLGARGITEREMSRAMGYDIFSLNQSSVHPGFGSIVEHFGREGTPYILKTVSLVLVRNGYSILENYTTDLHRYYKAAVQNVDFAKEGDVTLNKINDFVAHHTNNQIQKALAQPLDEDTVTFLMNIVYFKGQWKTKFDQRFTRPSTFYNNGKIPRTVPMMNMKSKFLFSALTNLDSYALEMPYEGDDMSMLLVLPKTRNGLHQLERFLLSNPSLLDSIYESLQEVMVDVSLPRFTLDGDYNLKDSLHKMGMGSLFSDSTANLSGISGRRDLVVTKVVHKSVIEVNEEGSEASAFSGIATGIRIGGPPAPLFNAEHPFLFLIRDRTTGIILFMGRVTKL